MGAQTPTERWQDKRREVRPGRRGEEVRNISVLRRCAFLAHDIGRHRFNTQFWKTRERKPDAEIVEMSVPPIIDSAEFEAVQALLKTRSPALTAPRITSDPTLLTGICFCAGCGMAMTLRTGKGGRYRYYTCSTKARRGETGCPVARNARSAERRISPNCASVRPKQTPNSSGSTTPSRTASPISRTRC